MSKTIKITVYGRVQGVGYRYFAKKQAEKLQVFGFVKNMPDDSVKITAQGNEDKLNKFIDKCYDGPRNSFVTHLDLQEIETANVYSAFIITT